MGRAGNDRLTGRDGRDELDGGEGADLMCGGRGSDVYKVDNANDVVIEIDGEGGDTVLSATREAAKIAKARGLPAARQADLYARTLRLIALRSDELDLSLGEMAQQLKVSLRLLQKVFAERGETIMASLWDERVNRAARLLTAPEAADRSITDIAFACGFNDSAHFGRVFAARKGTAPSRRRKQAHEQTGARA
jgi:AraC-like DNA-binding protein